MPTIAPIVDGEAGASVRGKLNAALAAVSALVPATTAADGLLSAADKGRLDAIETLAAAAVPGLATTTADGLLSAADLVRLNGLETLIDGQLQPILDALDALLG